MRRRDENYKYKLVEQRNLLSMEPYTLYSNENWLKVLSEIHLGTQLFQSVFISSIPNDNIQYLLSMLGIDLCPLYH